MDDSNKPWSQRDFEERCNVEGSYVNSYAYNCGKAIQRLLIQLEAKGVLTQEECADIAKEQF